MRAAKFALTLIYHKPSLCLPGSIVWRQEGTSSNISFSISTFPSSKKVTTRKAMLWLLTSPKNSNRSFSFLSEKKSNFVKALDHLEASQQQSINISIEEGDAACGAQLGCGPAKPSPWITFDKMLSLSRFMFYEFTLWLLASSFADTGWNLTNTLQHWGNLPLLSPLYITTYSKLFCLLHSASWKSHIHSKLACCLLSFVQCISVAGGSNQYLRGLVVSPLNSQSPSYQCSVISTFGRTHLKLKLYLLFCLKLKDCSLGFELARCVRWDDPSLRV